MITYIYVFVNENSIGAYELTPNRQIFKSNFFGGKFNLSYAVIYYFKYFANTSGISL